MNEPKRRGRPPKARPLEPQVMELKVDGPVVRETVWLNPETHTAQQSAQAFASRVYAGQSLDLPRKERLARVAAALAKRGMSMEGVEL